MFEVKVETLQKEYKENLEKSSFLKAYRDSQITEVIRSLSEEDFTNLQLSFVNLFGEIKELFSVTKSAIKNMHELEDILSLVEKEYRDSSETSQYYKDMFLEIISFLKRNQDELALEDGQKQQRGALGYKFYNEIVIPTYEFQEGIYVALCDRNLTAQRIEMQECRDLSIAKKRLALYQSINQNLETDFDIEPIRRRLNGELNLPRFFEEEKDPECDLWNEKIDYCRSLVDQELEESKKKQLQDIASDRKKIAEIWSTLQDPFSHSNKEWKEKYRSSFKILSSCHFIDHLRGCSSIGESLVELRDDYNYLNKMLFLCKKNKMKKLLERWLDFAEDNIETWSKRVKENAFSMEDNVEVREKVKNVIEGIIEYEESKKSLYLVTDNDKYDLINEMMVFKKDDTWDARLQQKMARLRRKLMDYATEEFQLTTGDRGIVDKGFKSGKLDQVTRNILDEIEKQKALELEVYSNVTTVEEYLTLLKRAEAARPVQEEEVIDTILQKMKTMGKKPGEQ